MRSSPMLVALLSCAFAAQFGPEPHLRTGVSALIHQVPILRQLVPGDQRWLAEHADNARQRLWTRMLRMRGGARKGPPLSGRYVPDFGLDESPAPPLDARNHVKETMSKLKQDRLQIDHGSEGMKSFVGAPHVSNTAMQPDEVEGYRSMVRRMMQHAWSSYRDRAWGADEVGPVDGAPVESATVRGAAVTLVDALTTLKLMGLEHEFDDGARWVEQNLTNALALARGPQSFFETTIRGLGGLVGAYSLSGRQTLLEQAKGLGSRLSHGFSVSAPHFPAPRVDLANGETTWWNNLFLSEVGSIQLEFRSLSALANDFQYEMYPDEGLYQVLAASGDKGLVPSRVNSEGGLDMPVFDQDAEVSVGGMSDSYYEYLLKLWLQDSKKEDFLKQKWVQVVKEVHEKLLKKTSSGLTYLASLGADGETRDRMEHLACFFAGNLELGYRTLPKADVEERWHETAVELTKTCHAMYAKTISGLSPDAMDFGVDMRLPHLMEDRQYRLRPETAEAIYYLYYFTGEPRYQHMAKDLVEAIEKHTKAPYGYAQVEDVGDREPAKMNRMESYFLAETLLYLYLTFSPREVLDLNKYVLSTEGHPLPVDTKGAQRAKKPEVVDIVDKVIAKHGS